MSKYVFVSGFDSKSKPGMMHFAKSDVQYNLKLARRKNDKKTYVKMLTLRSHISRAIREQDSLGNTIVSVRRESWKNGEKYVVRNNGRFKAVIPA
jgi:hypothetical protein